MSRAVILLRVSDRNVRARQRFRDLAQRLQAHLAETTVLAAYVVPGQFPNALALTDAVERLVSGGATEIAVVPHEVEWKTGEWQDIPDTVQELAREHPQARFRLAQPMGAAVDLLDTVVQQCDEAWSGLDITTADVNQMVSIGAQPPIAVARLKPGEAPQLPAHNKHVLMCFGRVCQQEDSDGIYERLTSLIAERGLEPQPGMHGLMGRQRGAAEHQNGNDTQAIKVTRTKCLGPCAGAPMACVYPEGTFYWGLSKELMPQFIDEVLVGNGSLPSHAFRVGEAAQ